ncbi:MAG TPA: FkbM family methyltransferase [Woeseiaceae bacterium]|nr:FkbM family methyltransferase [Woeseiaceae bacterium]
MKRKLRRLAAYLPASWQQELRRHYFSRQIRANSFRIREPEYDLLPSLVSVGDWVLDIGANVGHYTMRLSELVGENGRVISFEPVPETFELLARHAAMTPCKNISLVNAAASASVGLSTMSIPKFEDAELRNYYRAQLSAEGDRSGFPVLRLTVDSLALPNAVQLVKIDTEGHELSVLLGMKRLLERDRPTVIAEDGDPEVIRFLEALGYASEKLATSCNRLFRPRSTIAAPG